MQFKKSKPNQNEEGFQLQKIDELSARFDEKLNLQKPIKSDLKDHNQEEKDEKKNYTISLKKKIIAELEEFLEDFGDFGETKSSFIQNAISNSINQRKLEMKEKLLDKIKKLEN
ncbi:hypothetical protein BKH42_08555 [Helicobacter sp. 13S00482-2]|nr:hypothetical protein BKH42_08555 [Helicobacter sp. 13S00482-2]